MKILSLLASASLSICSLVAVSLSFAQDAAPSSPAFFDAKVKPVLAASCYKCHTERMSGGLRLDSREAMLKGGDSGAAIVPGAPEKSLLVEAVHQSGDLKMPPKGAKLTDAQIADIEAWIKAGAVWSTAAPAPAAGPPANAAAGTSEAAGVSSSAGAAPETTASPLAAVAATPKARLRIFTSTHGKGCSRAVTRGRSSCRVIHRRAC